MKTLKLSRAAVDSLWIACGAIATAAALTACTDTGVAERTQPAPGVSALSVPAESVPAIIPKEAPSVAPSLLRAPTPTETRAAYREGVALYRTGSYIEAASQLEIAAAGRPDHAYTQYLLGLSLWKSGKNEEAETALEHAAEIDEGSSKTWINLARVRMDLNDAVGTLAAADSALGIDASSADALHQRGRALVALGRTDDGLTTLQQAHVAAPENGYIANTLGFYLLQSGRDGEAVSVLEEARGRLPKVAYVRNNLGVSYERTGQLEKAVEEFDAVVELGDPNGKATASLARLEPLLPEAIAQRRRSPQPESVPIADSALSGDVDGSQTEPRK